MDFSPTKDEGCHHCFGAGDTLLGEQSGGGAETGGGGFEFEDTLKGLAVLCEDGGENE